MLLVTKAMPSSPFRIPNIRRFIAFRILFNARFYYPVFTIIFLDFGLSLEQFAILNAVWAATIVLLEVPSGALADTIGRKNLVVASAAIMVLEVGLICVAPIGEHPIVFYLFLLNRILSGTAEAAASGADEALAYDSLKKDGDENEWSHVLESQMKWQSLAFVIAMSAGAFLYDAGTINRFLSWIGSDFEISKAVAMRLPLILTFLLGLLALKTALSMEELEDETCSGGVTSLKECRSTLAASFRKTLDAGAWILRTPAAFLVILAGLLFDHAGRMAVTLNSQYYRQIDLPEASFGLISSALAMMGVFIPKYAKRLVATRSQRFNFFLLGAITLLAFWTMTLFIPHWGALSMALLYICFFLTGFFVSHYLNQTTSSEMRATVLSFKGLSYNLAYGGIGILYAQLVANLRSEIPPALAATPQAEGQLFKEAMQWFPGYFVVLFAVVFAIAFFVRRKPTQS